MTTPKDLSHFSEAQKLKAQDLKQRILAGEKIPLSELSAFLSASDRILTVEKKKRELPPTDVSFF